MLTNKQQVALLLVSVFIAFSGVLWLLYLTGIIKP